MAPVTENEQPLGRHLPNFPTRIKCDVGGEWKLIDCYSASQLQKYQRLLQTRKGVTPARSGIACRTHSGEQVHELQCQGPCNKWHPLNYFSKRSRKQSNGAWCLACIQWAEANEPGYLPWVPPMAVRSPEEEEMYRPESGQLNDNMIFGDHDGNSEGIETITASVDGRNTVDTTITGQGDRTPQHPDSVFAGPSSSQGPDELTRGIEALRVSPGQLSEMGGSTLDADRAVSLRQSTVSGRQSDGPYQSLFRSFGGPSGTPSPSTVSTAVAPSVPRRLPQDFNGYDPQGQLHRLTKQPTLVSEDTSTIYTGPTVKTEPVTVSKSGWAKPKRRKTQMEPPEYLRKPEFQPKPCDENAPPNPLDFSDDGESPDEC